MDSFRRALSGLFTRRPVATLAVESEAPASVLPPKPSLGRHSRPFGADHYYTLMGQSLMSRVVSNPDHLTVNDYRAMLDRDDAVKWCVKYSRKRSGTSCPTFFASYIDPLKTNLEIGTR